MSRFCEMVEVIGIKGCPQHSTARQPNFFGDKIAAEIGRALRDHAIQKAAFAHKAMNGFRPPGAAGTNNPSPEGGDDTGASVAAP